MSSLAGTTWTLNLEGMDPEKVTFNTDGTATFGGSEIYYWGETGNGEWITYAVIDQYHTGNYRAQVYSGTHASGMGKGTFTNGYDGAKLILSTFTMSKS